jgi:hypothetical protein
MALLKNMTVKSNFGDEVVFKDVYIKIDTLTGNKDSLKLKVSGKKQQNDNVVFGKDYVFTPNLSGANFIRQGYEHLKTLPEFAGSTDC